MSSAPRDRSWGALHERKHHVVPRRAPVRRFGCGTPLLHLAEGYMMSSTDEGPIGFTAIQRAIIEDPDLSWVAKGVYAYMLSMVDHNGEFLGEQMIYSQERAESEQEIHDALRELEDYGLLVTVSDGWRVAAFRVQR